MISDDLLNQKEGEEKEEVHRPDSELTSSSVSTKRRDQKSKKRLVGKIMALASEFVV